MLLKYMGSRFIQLNSKKIFYVCYDKHSKTLSVPRSLNNYLK